MASFLFPTQVTERSVKMGVLFGLLGGLILGIVAGYCLSKHVLQDELVGTLRVDRSDPDEPPYLFVELEPNGMSKINEMKTVRFKVNLESYIPRK